MKKERIRVLVVDDSLFMRTLVSDMLTADPEIKVVDTARDGEEALRKAAKLRPDCITLDLVMPGWNGLTTLGRIMSQCPTPVVVLSAHSREGALATMQCLEAGAVGFVPKPSGELSLDISSVREQLLREVKTAASAHFPQRGMPRSENRGRTVPRSDFPLPRANGIIVIGASTGGPQALEGILQSLPPNRHVPMLLVQHMPSFFFTSILAEHLSKDCELEVAVAEDGQALQDGGTYVAPAGYHTRLAGGKTATRMSLTEAKANTLSPCIDIAMKSAAEVFGPHAIGIILTGMGEDGREGMKAIKQAGGKTIAQDESALIFGMPRAVIDAGLADKVVPADAMAEAIKELLP